VVEKPAYACRVGGDEFAILLPETDELAGEMLIQTIQDLVAINNTFYPDLTLSLSMGVVTAGHGERLEFVVKRADLAMLEAKRQHYFGTEHDRRRSQALRAS
jgi:diguanylate cyclase (GGDEF)-like protein